MHLGNGNIMRSFNLFSVLFALLFFAVGGFLYESWGPTTDLGGSTAWYLGLAHGFYAPFNLLLSIFSDENKTIFQAGGDGWYSFCWLLGAGGLFGGARRPRSTL